MIAMENHCKKIDSEISEAKKKWKSHSNYFKTVDQALNDMHQKIQYIERQSLSEENVELKERVIQQQSRSMGDDLIFKGIPDDYNPYENTEAKIKNFIKNELKCEDEIKLHVVHRLKPN